MDLSANLLRTMLGDGDIYRYNPWWARAGWEADDPHLRRLRQRAVRLPAPQVDALDLRRPAVHVMRGPRQVGKSTDLKLLVARALRAGIDPRAIVYLSLDLLENRPASELVATVGRALELAGVRSADAARLILLDEVTITRDWRTAVKVLWDDGRIDADVVVCTGSSAIDLAEAAERLPGRRGAGRDILVLPRGFAAFAHALDPEVPLGPGLTIAELLHQDGRAELERRRVHLPALRGLLERYLLFGGLPAAVAEAATGAPEPSEEVRRVLWDALLREVQRRGASGAAAQALMERIARSLGAKVSWSRIARELAVPLSGSRRRSAGAGGDDPRTVQGYVEMLAINYFALVLYFWRPDAGGGDLAKDKKIYFGDPLLRTITAERVGLARDVHADVENALALALYRRYEPSERSAEGFPAPERLHVWGTRSGGEIDFVCGPRSAIEALEVADWVRVNRQKATGPMRALPGRPSLVATRDELSFTATANLVPAALVLWALSG